MLRVAAEAGKAKTESTLNKIPLIGSGIAHFVSKIKSDIKSTMYESTFFEDLGFNYMGPIDGHNIEEILDAFDKAKTVKNKPTAIVAKTVKGKGVSFMEDKCDWHGSAPNAEQYAQAMAELDEAMKSLEV